MNSHRRRKMEQRKLSLIEYSNQYGVSISTLRRRIKDKSIDFVEEGGKYFIWDKNNDVSRRQRLATQKEALQKIVETKEEPVIPVPIVSSQEMGFSAAAKMLEELKKAYTQILHEREDQITQLREEVSDLKTLVRVLESENERLRK